MKYKNEIQYLEKYIKENNLDKDYYDTCIKELEKGRPIQYIIGNVNFYGYNIKVNEDVLIPRYETELLCEKIIKKIKNKKERLDILDLGTGSGCIAITIKKEIDCNMDALDISNKALDIARENAKDNNVDINFINADMTTYKDKKYDIIISNPPYISYDEEIMDIVKNNEPHEALFAEDNGLYFYKRIIDNIPFITKDKYLIAFEIGFTQSKDIIEYANKKLKDINITVDRDLSNKERYLFIEKDM